MVSGPRIRRGQSSDTNSAVATATGTPMHSAMADVTSVPTSSGSAPKRWRDTSQSLVNVKPNTPNLVNAGHASTRRRMKKKPISARTRPATPVRPHRSARSWARTSGSRPTRGRPPARASVAEPASMPQAIALGDRAPVALEAVRRLLGLRQDLGGQLRVLELAKQALSLAQAVVHELLHGLGRALGLAGLAHVLVDDHERLRGDRVGLRVRRVDDRDAEVRGDVDSLAGRGRRLERRLHELTRLVLHGGRREVVLQGVGLLDVADGALLLLHGGGHAV